MVPPSRRRPASSRPYDPQPRSRLRLEQLEDRIVPATINWDGGGDGISWNDASNWLGDLLPGLTDDVVIDHPGTGTIVRFDSGATTVRSIVNNRDLLQITGGTLATTEGLTIVGGRLEYLGGDLDGALSLLGSSLLLDEQAGAAEFVVNGDSTLAGTIGQQHTVRLDSTGSADYFTASLLLTADVSNHGTVILTGNADHASELDAGSFTFTNAADGHIEVTGTAGIVDVPADGLPVKWLRGNLVHQGSISVASGGELALYQGVLDLAGGTIAGSHRVMNKKIRNSEASAVNTTWVLQDSSTLDSDILANTTLHLLASNFDYSRIILGRNVTNYGTLVLDSVDTFHTSFVTGNNFTFTNAAAGRIEARGLFQHAFVGGTLVNQGTIDVAAGTRLQISQGIVDSAGGTISGMIQLHSTRFRNSVASASMNNWYVAGSINLDSDVLSNTTLHLQPASSVVNLHLSTNVSNHGTIILDGFTPNSSFSYSSGIYTGNFTFTNAAAGHIQVTAAGTPTKMIEGNFINRGTIEIADGGILQLNLGLLDIGGSITGDNVVTHKRIRNNTASTVGSGPWNLTGTSNFLDTDVLANTTLRVLDTLRVSTNVTNHGTLILEPGQNSPFITLDVSGFTVTNATDGHIVARGATSNILGSMIHSGSIEVAQESRVHFIGGLFELAGGTVSGTVALQGMVFRQTLASATPVTLQLYGNNQLASDILEGTTLEFVSPPAFQANSTLSLLGDAVNRGTVRFGEVNANEFRYLLLEGFTLTNAVSGTIEAHAGVNNILDRGNLINRGVLFAEANTKLDIRLAAVRTFQQLQGSINVGSGATIAVSEGKVQLPAGAISGILDLNNVSLALSDANTLTGSIRLRGASSLQGTIAHGTTLILDGYYTYLSNNLINHGEIILTEAAVGGVLGSPYQFTNESDGTLKGMRSTTISGNFVSRGSIESAAGNYLVFNTGFFELAGGVVHSDVLIMGSTLRITANPSELSTLHIGSGTLDTDIPENVRLRVWNPFLNSASLSIIQPVANRGILEIGSITTTRTESNIVQISASGVLTNEASGLILSSTRGVTAALIKGNVVNRGTINAPDGAKLTLSDGNYVSDGGRILGTTILGSKHLYLLNPSLDPTTELLLTGTNHLDTDIPLGFRITFTASSSTLILTGNRTNHGTIDSRGVIEGTGYTFTNAPEGILNILELRGSLRNQGHFVVGFVTRLGAPGALISNEGIMQFENGELVLTGDTFINQPGGLIGGFAGKASVGLNTNVQFDQPNIGTGGFRINRSPASTLINFINRGALANGGAEGALYDVVRRYEGSTNGFVIELVFIFAYGADIATFTNPANYSSPESAFASATFFQNRSNSQLQVVRLVPVERGGEIRQITINGPALKLRFGEALTSQPFTAVVLPDSTPGSLSLVLERNSDTGTSTSDDLTSDTTPTFEVSTTRSGILTIDFDGDGQVDLQRDVPTADRYTVTSPVLSDGVHRVTATLTWYLQPDEPFSFATSETITIDTTGPRIIQDSATLLAPATSVTVHFSEPMDRSSVGWAQLSGPGIDGSIPISVSTQSLDGMSISFLVPLTVAGSYALAFDPIYTRDLAGNPLDHAPGQPTAEYAVYRFDVLDLTGPLVASFSPLGRTNQAVSVFQVAFTEPILAGSFTADDVVILRPDGSRVAAALLSVTALTDTTYEVRVPELTVDGVYEVTVGPDIRDRAGNPMRLPGGVGSAPYRTSFTIDRVPPELLFASPASTANFLLDHLELTFSEIVDLESLPDALVLTGPEGAITITGVSQVFGSSYRLDFAPQATDGNYELRVGTRVKDLAGNYLTAPLTHTLTLALPVEQLELHLDQPAGGNIEQPGARDAWYVELTAGQQLFFELQALTSTGDLQFRLIAPDGSPVFTSSATAADLESSNQGPFTVAVSGSYRVQVRGVGYTTGNYQFTLYEVPDALVHPVQLRDVASGSIETPGATEEWRFTLDTPQTIFFDFQRVLATRAGGAVVHLRLLAPDGSAVLEQSLSTTTPDQADGLLSLTQSGTYRLLVDPEGNDTLTYRFQIWDVPAPEEFTALVGEPALGTIETPGSADRWTVTVDRLQWVYIDLQTVVDGSVRYSLFAPDGTELVSRTNNSDAGPLLLTQPGAYTLVFHGVADATPTYEFVIVDAEPRVQQTRLDSVVSDTISGPGRNDAWQFTAAAGQRLYFDLQLLSGNSGPVAFQLFDARGIELLQTTATNADGGDAGPLVLTTTGRYTLVVAPGSSATPTYRFRLWEVGADQLATLPLGQVEEWQIETPGTVHEWRFNINGETFIALDVQAVQNGSATFELLDPNGERVYFNTATPATAFMASTGRRALTIPGTYRLRIAGVGADTPSYRFQMLPMSNPAILALQGAAKGSTGGIPDHWQFQATAGDFKGLDVLGVRASGATPIQVSFRLLAPDGSILFETVGTSDDPSLGDHAPIKLLQNGTYTVEVLSTPGQRGDYEFRLVDLPPVSVRATTPDRATTGSITALGAMHRWQVALEAGTALFFDIQSVLATRTDAAQLAFTLSGPDGSILFTRSAGAGDFNAADFGVFTTPRSGTYTLTITPVGNFTGSYGFALWTVPAPDHAELTLAELMTGAIESPGRQDRWGVVVGAGEKVFLDVRAQQPSGVQLRYTLLGVDGSTVIWTGTTDSPVLTLPEAGEYTLQVSGVGDAAGTYSFKLYRIGADGARPATLDDLVAGDIAIPGTSDGWAFDIQQGGDYFLYVASVLAGAGTSDAQTLVFTLLDPMGRALLTRGVDSTVGTELLGPVSCTLPGVYRVVVSGLGDNTGSYAFRLSPSTRGLTNVLVPEDAGNSLLDLGSAFAFTSGPVSYQIVGNTNTTLFDAVLLDNGQQTLTLDYKANAFGTATITVRAFAGSEFAQASFQVVVSPINDLPTALGIADVVVPANAPDTVIRLFDSFRDVEDAAENLTYTLTNISNRSLFADLILNAGTGQLRLRYAPDAFGVSDLTVRATDSAGGFVETTFRVTVNPGGQADRYEPNDTFGSATDLGTLPGNGQVTLFANIHQPGDLDFYHFTLAQDGVFFSVETTVARTGGALDPVLTLYSADQFALTYNDDIVGRDSRLNATLNQGDYYVQVKSFAGTLGNYQLTFTTLLNGPRVLRLSPNETLASSPTLLQLDLDNNDLNSTTLNLTQFRLEQIDANGLVSADVSSRLAAVSYDATLDRVTLTLAAPLEHGGYRLTMRDTITNTFGRALDGDGSGTPGGDFTGVFAIDSHAPTGTLRLGGVAAGSGGGTRYTFTGTVNDDFPAVNGESLRIELDVDGDGFDDGFSLVPRSRFGTPFSVLATTPLAGGQGLVAVRARFLDERGNVSAPVSATVDTGVPVVAALRSVGNTLQVTYNVAGLAGVADATSYRVTGEAVQSVFYDPATRTATLLFKDGTLSEGTYTVTIFSGQAAVHLGPLDLDGDGDGVPGGNFGATVAVDRTPPVLVAARLSPFDDNVRGVTDDNRGFAARPTILVSAADHFPTTSTGQLIVRLDTDGDGQYDDGETRVTPTTSDLPVSILVQATTPPPAATLSGTALTYGIQVTDAAGNEVTTSLNVFLDRTGPAVQQRSVQILDSDSNSVPDGLRFTLVFDEALDPRAALNPANYRLVRAGGDRDFSNFDGFDVSAAITAISYVNNQVVVTTNLTSLPNDDYQLIVRSGVTDVAGNGLRAGDYTTSAQLNRGGPRLLANGAFLAAGYADQPADRVFLQFEDVDLDPTTATNLANYQLVHGDSGTTVAITTAFYDAYSDRVILSGFGALTPGDYRLTVRAGGIRSTSGVALDGNGDGQPGDDYVTQLSVPAPTVTTTLDPTVLQGNANALAAQAETLLPQIAASQKVLTTQAFAARLLEEARLVLAQATGSASDITAAVNARLRSLYEAERGAEYGPQAYLPPEMLILWTSQSRFLLNSPYDSAVLPDGLRLRVGFDVGGRRIEQLVGATLVGKGSDPDALALVIVPVDLMRELLAQNPPAFRPDGVSVLPNLQFTVELESTGGRALASALYFGPNGTPGTQLFTAEPGATSQATLDLSNVLAGFDTNIPLFNQDVLLRLQAVVGDLTQVQNLLVLWFDPVDFVLRDARGQQIGFIRTGQRSYNSIPGSFYSGDGATELVVIPNALSDIYSLSLYGVGADFRGQATYFANGRAITTKLQGVLGGSQEVTAWIDLRLALLPGQNPGTSAVTDPLGTLAAFFDLARMQSASASAIVPAAADSEASNRAMAIVEASSEDKDKDKSRRSLVTALRRLIELENARAASTAATGPQGVKKPGEVSLDELLKRAPGNAASGTAAFLPAIADLFALDSLRLSFRSGAGAERLQRSVAVLSSQLGVDVNAVATVFVDLSTGTVRLLDAAVDPARLLAGDLRTSLQLLSAALESEANPALALLETELAPLRETLAPETPVVVRGVDTVAAGISDRWLSGSLLAVAVGAGIALGGVQAWSRDDENQRLESI